MSSDEEILTVRKKKYVVDSDLSDTNENVGKQELDDNSNDQNDTSYQSPKKKKKKTRRLKTIGSSSESDDDDNDSILKNVKHSSTSNISPIKNGDISQEEENHSSGNNESVLSGMKETQLSKNSWYKNSDLFTDESSDEDNVQKKGSYKGSGDERANSSDDATSHDKEHASSEDEELELEKTIGRSPSPPTSPLKERKSKKKALDEMEEIRKESQRMIRETPVAIPYHRPRQRTLAEFRERRKATPKISLHTSADLLVTAWKAIEQREKEAETFYKSESSEDEVEEETRSIDVQENHTDLKNNETTEETISLTTQDQNNEHEDMSKCSEGSELTKLENNVGNSAGKSEASVYSKSFATEFSNKTENNESNNLKCDLDVEKTSLINSEVVQDCAHKETEVNHINSVKELEGEIHRCANKKDSLANDDIKDSDLSKDDYCTKKEESSVDEPNKMSSCNLNSVDSLPNTEEFSLRLSESQSELDSLSKSNEQYINISTIERHENPIINHTECPNNYQSSIMEVDNAEEDKDKKNEGQSISGMVTSESQNEQNEEVNSNDQCNNEFKKQIEDDIKENIDSNKLLNTTNEIDNIEYKLRMKYNYEPKIPVASAPKISGAEDGVIDLEDKVVKPGVDGLMERFYTHLSYKKKPVKKKTSLELSIVSAETDKAGHVSAIKEEIVKVLVGSEETEEDPTLAKPGAKLARLRTHLRAEMCRQREEQWSKKQQEQRLYEDEIYEGEKDVCDALDEDNDNEDGSKSDGEESEEEEEEEEEEELEEDDIDMSDKKNKKKSAFVDDEAEESDDGVVKDGEEESSDSFIKRPAQKKIPLKRTNTEDMFLSQELLKSSNSIEEDELQEELPSFQKPRPVEEKAEEMEGSETSSVCPSPAFQLTALEGKDVNRFNWSAPTTPCKDFLSPKTVTPVRGLLQQLIERSPSVGSQDLENLCSGQFVSQPVHDAEENNTQDFQLFLAEDSQVPPDHATPVKILPEAQRKSLDGKDDMRSLLVDDDEELADTLVNKKVKKLIFSDDEDEGENSQQRQGNLAESDVEDEDGEVNLPAEEVDYDSEENEVVKTAGDFLDKEAELSEEEWESEDEDERGLDTLEMEEADREHIDQRRLQRELGQMHMKQMLIEDKKDIRLLQEMLLEDGELHSEGRRQRLFRWSNNTFGEEDNKAQIDSDDDNADEDEDEESWRRSRHEREQYLKEHKKKVEQLELVVEEESDSQLLKLGQKALKRMSSSSQETKLTPTVDPLASPNPKKPFQQLLKRGSFLTRGEQVLSRLAQMVASSDATTNVNQPKNSRNFVFASISPTKDKGEEPKPIQLTH
ncbi:hypothetical protein J6590_001424 [Homalodisca vitripennis]|nr:hypothetical protein J6590_001424 [Homalodisca vitripennis]